MVNTMQKAYTAARKAIESTFRGTMSVYEYGTKRDEKTKLQRSGETCILTDVPCKVSFESSTSAAQTDTAAKLSQSIKVFVSPNVEIKPGSKLLVQQDGTETAYKCAGQPAIYPTHREYNLELFKGWA